MIRSMIEAITLRVIMAPFELLYRRKQCGIDPQLIQKFPDTLDYADVITIKQGKWALWNGWRFDAFRVFIEMNIQKFNSKMKINNTNKFVQYTGIVIKNIVVSLFQYGALILKTDTTHEKDSFSSIYLLLKNSLKQKSLKNILLGLGILIIGTNLMHGINSLLKKYMPKVYFKQYFLHFILQRFTIMALTYPFFTIAHRMLGNNIGIEQSILKGSLYAGFPIMFNKITFDYFVWKIITGGRKVRAN